MAWKRGATADGPRVDLYQDITDKIVAAVEAGAGSWQRPWTKGGDKGSMPVNATTGARYRGINVLNLWASGLEYDTSEWGTFKQWQSLSKPDAPVCVRKGEHGTRAVYFKKNFVADKNKPLRSDGSPDGRTFPMLKAFTVFNADQVDGYTPKPAERPSLASRIEAAEEHVRKTGVRIVHGHGGAFYRPGADFIGMPDLDRFRDTRESSATEGYYSTLFHELTHWSGTPMRCDRRFGKRFGDEAYAIEELVAELGAAFQCGTLGIRQQPRPDHAEYVAHWLQVLKNDKRAIFTAAAAASTACDFLTGLGDEAEDESEELEALAA